MKRQISNVNFEQQKSSVNGYREFKVSFLMDKKKEAYFTFVKEGKDVNYLAEAKKSFYADLKSGQVMKAVNKSHFRARPALITATSVLGAIAVTSTSLLVWKLLSNNNPVVPDEIQYMENFTNEKKYMKLSGSYELIYDKTREYDKNWQVIKETTVNPEITAVKEWKYNENYLPIEIHEKTISKTGELISENSQNNKYDSEGRVIESTSTNIQGEKTMTNKMIANYVDNENFVKTSETKIDGVVNSTSEYESKSIIKDNEKTLTINRIDIRYKDGEVLRTNKQDLTFLTRRDDLNRTTFQKETAVNTSINPTKETVTTNETATSYTYDSSEGLSCSFEEYTKIINNDNVTGNSRKGHRVVNGLNIEETYDLYKDPEFKELKTYGKLTLNYDDLNRPVTKKEYVDVEMVSVNDDEHFWIPSNFMFASYIGNSEKTLSSFNMVLNEDEFNYEVNDTERKVDKYNRWTREDSISYTFTPSNANNLSATPDPSYYIVREYAEPVPVNPNIPQPEEE